MRGVRSSDFDVFRNQYDTDEGNFVVPDLLEQVSLMEETGLTSLERLGNEIILERR